MVTVEPFFYQKTTAFKERLQMINKINEIVESLNGVYDANQVREYVSNELLKYYTKEEVDNAIASIDFTPYATKTYVNDAIDSIDLTPYATNERVNEEIETLDNKIDTKQNILSVSNGLELSNDNLSLKDFVVYPSNNWSNIIKLEYGNFTVTTDCIIQLVDSNLGIQTFIYIPKGNYNGTVYHTIFNVLETSGTNIKSIDFYKLAVFLSSNITGNTINGNRLRMSIDLDTSNVTYSYSTITINKRYNGDGCKLFYKP